MEENDSLRTLLYSLARFGLFWLINIFAMIIGKTAILGVVGTFVPRLHLYDNPELLSFISWLIPAWLLTWLFWDDGKRHTAYGLYNPTIVTTVLLITGIVYYAPVFLMEYADNKLALSTLDSIYFPCYWLSVVSDDAQVYGLLGVAILVVMSIASYLLSHKYYVKKFAEEEE